MPLVPLAIAPTTYGGGTAPFDLPARSYNPTLPSQRDSVAGTSRSAPNHRRITTLANPLYWRDEE
ncbi:MAG: hypothetical protein ACPHF4_05230 [Rubripirellula sp.]